MARSWRSLSWREARLLIESMLLVVMAAPAIRVIPFRHVGRLASRKLRRTVASTADRDEIIRQVRWAVMAAAKRSPLRAMCIEQGLTAQLMLRRRGVDSTMFYGVAPATQDKPLSAHVWVGCGELDVLGTELASSFALLATFPAQAPETISST